MKPFLLELAEKIIKMHPQLEDITFVFPNRRAQLYFRKHLSSLLDKPTFAPRLLTIEDFIDLHTEGRRLDAWMDGAS